MGTKREFLWLDQQRYRLVETLDNDEDETRYRAC